MKHLIQSVLTALVATAAPAGANFPADTPATASGSQLQQIGQSLLQAIDADAAAQREVMLAAAGQLGNMRAAARLREAVELSGTADSPAVVLREALIAVGGDLTFKPFNEAQTPPGWPAQSVPGEVELKSYPGYRMAVVDTQSGLPEGVWFWQLFGHIQRNQIKMTAPVEMGVKLDDGRMDMTSMAFLYETADQGAIGTDGAIRIVDIEPYQAVTVAFRGELNRDDLRLAAELLDQWLKANPRYAAAGNARVLGYNGPQVRSADRYHEVQQPVALHDE